MTPDPDQIVPCQGLLTLKSGKTGAKKGYARSTAAIQFWAPAAGLVNTFIPNSNSLVYAPVDPVVTGTTGSWPKPDGIQTFTWGTVATVRGFCCVHTKERRPRSFLFLFPSLKRYCVLSAESGGVY